MTPHTASDVYGLLAATLRVLPEPIVLCDNDHVLFANDAAQRLLGGSRAAGVKGAPCEVFFDPEYADVNAEQLRYVLNNLMEFTDYPVKVRTLDGVVLRLRADARPVSLDGVTLAMVTLAV